MAGNVERFSFANSNGQKLSARIDRPDGPHRAYALFAHCFACSKDILAASRIALELTKKGVAVVRFDFTGLGASEGEFANTNFTSNVSDLIAAADRLRDDLHAPEILIGHSLGGAAVLAAAGKIPEVKAVVTIGAPADPGHVTHIFESSIEEIEQDGVADVNLGGRPFQIKKQFIDDVRSQHLEPAIGHMKRALLILHSPLDDVVGIDNASQIFLAARHPRSFVSLDQADHFLSRKEDAEYAADVIASWSERYLSAPAIENTASQESPGTVVVSESGTGTFTNSVATQSGHVFHADEPVTLGGSNVGPTPYDLLLSSLGTCKVMTMRMYANRKKYKLSKAEVRLRHEKIHANDCADCETKSGKIDRIDVHITLDGDLTEQERQAIFKIAERCPVHRTITSEIDIQAALAPV